MVSFTVRMEFEATDRAAVEEIVQKLTPASRQEPGCINYIPHFVQDAPATLVIYEQYVDEAALEFHRETPHFQQFATNGIYKLVRARHLERLDAIA